MLHKTPLTSYKLPIGNACIPLKATEHMIGVIVNSEGWDKPFPCYKQKAIKKKKKPNPKKPQTSQFRAKCDGFQFGMLIE